MCVCVVHVLVCVDAYTWQRRDILHSLDNFYFMTLAIIYLKWLKNAKLYTLHTFKHSIHYHTFGKSRPTNFIYVAS